MASSSGREEGVTDADIRIFRASPLARRFPGLKDMPDEDVVTMILQDRRANGGRKLEGEHKSFPKTHFTPPPKVEVPPTPVFFPSNAAQAKEEAKRPDNECFISIGTPYSASHEDLMEDKTSDEAKRAGGGPWSPSSTSKARQTIRIDYFMNSQGANGRHAELEANKRRAAEGKHSCSMEASARGGSVVV